MRYTLAALLCLAWPAGAGAQTGAEGRYEFGTDYRFVDLSHTFKGGLMVDALYSGLPGIDEFYAGIGHQWKPTRGVVITPLVYGVLGAQNGEAGVALGGLVSFDRGGELGVSTGLLQSEGDWSWLVGPTFKWNDARGAWAASVRFGDDTELRVLRIFVL